MTHAPAHYIARRIAILAVVSGALLSGSRDVLGQSADNVAVVINDNSAESQRIGEYYARKRALPPSHVLRIRTSQDETVDRSTFALTIEQPLAAAIARERLQDRILYIVLTKGVPLRVAGTTGRTGTAASVDSELTLLYRRLMGQGVPVRGPVDNPYFLGDRDITEARPLTRKEHDIYLVSRLDAFTEPDIVALIDRAQSPATEGRVILDQRAERPIPLSARWFDLTTSRLPQRAGDRPVVLRGTPEPASDAGGLLGYFAWDIRRGMDRDRAGFVPGALAATFISSDARTFREPPPTWTPTNDWRNRAGWYAGSPQSLIADLIRAGATGVAGNIGEPYLESLVRPQILFPAYFSGRNLIEAFYLAIPHLSWQTVVVGDPLCAPFHRDAIPAADIDAGIDARTELPAYFSARRLQVAGAQLDRVHADAVRLFILAEGRRARGDQAGATEALHQAVAVDQRFTAAHLSLALMQQQVDEAGAIEAYRRVLEIAPRNVVALNNLALMLAVHDSTNNEAFALARKAHALAPQDPSVQDTVGWVAYLRGDYAEAARLIALAVKGAPTNADIRLHAAFVQDARGAKDAAAAELATALKLNPALAGRDDVRELGQRLRK